MTTMMAEPHMAEHLEAETLRHGTDYQDSMLADLELAYNKTLRQSLAWSIGVAALIASVVVYFVTSRLSTPLRLMKNASQRIAAGHYDERLQIRNKDEIGHLAESFNVMASTLEKYEQRRIELLANLAHEFKTPINNIKGYLDGLEDGLFSEKTETYGAMQRQLERLEHLIGDLSLLSRVESGLEKIELKNIAVTNILDQATLDSQSQYDLKNVQLESECQCKMDSLFVQADGERIQQVVVNLLHNALRHTPAQGVVKISCSHSDQAVVISVSDSGDGIPQEEQAFIFNRFYRVDKSRHDNGEQSSGIGLTIAKHYVEMHGGEIYLKNSSNQGSTFEFTLPLS